jgi:hypothetical protein
MTFGELRIYLDDPAKDASPAIVAARALMAERDHLVAVLSDRAAESIQAEVMKAEIAELKADVTIYRRENERLRGEVGERIKAPWEIALPSLFSAVAMHGFVTIPRPTSGSSQQWLVPVAGDPEKF